VRTKEELTLLRDRAIALRREGKSRREINQILGPMSNSTLNDALQDMPPPHWTRRPNAKDGMRAAARELRSSGCDYEEIAEQLGVSKSSISLWVRDMPVPPRLSYAENRRRSAEGVHRYWTKERAARGVQRAADVVAAAAEIGELTDREVLIAGALAYWCEGSKKKPHSRRDRVVFINSDPALVTFFLRFLDTAGVTFDDLIFRVYIHETADAEAALRFWLELTAAETSQFRHSALKRHNPKTVRKNVGENYHGCLRIDVRRSAWLYRKIEGWTSAAIAAAGLLEGAQGPVSLVGLECREPALLLRLVTAVRRGVIGSPQSFGVCCPGSSPGAGTCVTLHPSDGDDTRAWFAPCRAGNQRERRQATAGSAA
jgi:predicted transcriptional regulator